MDVLEVIGEVLVVIDVSLLRRSEEGGNLLG